MKTNCETNEIKKTNLATATKNAPAWVRREIKRLEKMVAMGGSSAAIEFERQANGLKKKYIWAFAHGGL